MPPPLEIVPLERTPRNVRRFLKVPYAIYRDDPHWVAPLLLDLNTMFSDANPLFQHAEMALWVARRDGRDVGRISGLIDPVYNRLQKDRIAFFGFFECIHDQAVAAALLDAVSAWAGAREMRHVLGPMNPTTNDECGLLVDGFDRPPVFMMTYNPRYYPALLEAAGFAKAKDLLAFFFDVANTPMDRFERLAQKVHRREPDIRIVPLRRKTLEAQLGQVMEVYNAAWEDNWGFVPMSDAEIRFMAGRLKPLLTEGLAYVAEKGSEPIGFLLAAPDFNEAFQPLRGRLCSPGLFRALPYLLRWKVPEICRVITLGVKPAYRGHGIEAAMLTQGLRTGFRLGFRAVESSWILEDNTAVQRLIELFGGAVYKTYRIYGRPVTEAGAGQV